MNYYKIILFLLILPFIIQCTTKQNIKVQNQELIKTKFQQIQIYLNSIISMDSFQLNEIPLYGGDKITEYQKSINSKFIKKVAESIDSGESKYKTLHEASNHYVDWGMNYFFQKDFLMAIKRFNQAWLLYNNYYKVFWWFGNYLGILEEFECSILFLEISILYNSSNANVYTDLAKSYNMNGFKQAAEGNLAALNTNLNKAIEIIEEGLKIKELSGLYHHWAISLFYLKQFEEAFEKINKAINLGENVDPAFIEAIRNEL